MKKLTIGLIAHNSMREDLVSLIKAHAEIMIDLNLIATEKTGKLIQDKTKLPVELVEDSQLGGDQQIGAWVVNKDIDAVIFLRDPLGTSPQEPDVQALLRVCDIHNVPLATNLSAAEAILHLIFEHPEVLTGHHLAAQYLEEMAAIHDPNN